MTMLKKSLGLVVLGWIALLIPIPFLSLFSGMGLTITGIVFPVQGKDISLDFGKRMALAVAILCITPLVFYLGISVYGLFPKPELPVIPQ